jgi:tetratricopeptide (TPR) repeat protein
MSLIKNRRNASLLLIVFMVMALATGARAQQSKLGKVDFPTSGSRKAQAHFIRGLAALHSFWFEEALDEFRESTKAEPDFMMGYWGEAMAHNHPLWSEQDTEAARKVIEKIKDTPKLTARERAYINAVRALYGEGDKLTRDRAYQAAMEKVYRDYPDDLEAACFYSLSLLGTVRPGDKGFTRQMKAGAIAMQVYEKNPDHPGAAHYIIHAFDDPEHAILALPAARRYAEIAPAAHHARHMPAHIFLQLGMWPEAAASNESAWAVSVEWVKSKGLPISARDYHSLHWLAYVYLQQGRYSKAEELLALKKRDMASAGNDMGVNRSHEDMAAALIVETEAWEQGSKVFASDAKASDAKAADDSASGAHAGHGPGQMPATERYRRNMALPVFVRGMAAAKAGSPDAQKAIAELQAMRKQMPDSINYLAKAVEIRELEIAATAAASKEKYDEAVELMKRATAIEEELSPPSGPPSLIKPSHELLGEILLQAKRYKEATEQFQVALSRQPNRARSLLGAARAAARSGDQKGAAEIYSAFLKQWRQADPQLPELREAQEYLKQSSAR